MSDNASNFSALLKDTYVKDVANEILYNNFVTYKLLPKAQDFKGLPQVRIPLIISMGGAAAADFARAQINAKANNTGAKQFYVDRVPTHGLSYLSDEVYRASMGSDAAFLEASKEAVNACFYNLGNDLELSIFGDGWGSIGQIKVGSAVNGTTLTLSNPNDARNFDLGNRLQVNTNKGDAAKAYGSSGLPLVVTKVDVDNGVLTFGSNVNDSATGVPTIAAGDFIYIDGNVSTTKQKITGFAGWLPTSAPGGSDSFFGLNRSQDVTKLSGARIDGTQSSIQENIIRAVNKVSQNGGKASHVLMSYDTWSDFSTSQEGKTRITDQDRTSTEIGFTAAKVAGPSGPVTVVVAQKCPSDKMYVLQMNTWKLHSLGDPINQTGAGGVGDGLDMVRSYNTPDWELRYSFHGGLSCSAPGWNAVVSL